MPRPINFPAYSHQPSPSVPSPEEKALRSLTSLLGARVPKGSNGKDEKSSRFDMEAQMSKIFSEDSEENPSPSKTKSAPISTFPSLSLFEPARNDTLLSNSLKEHGRNEGNRSSKENLSTIAVRNLGQPIRYRKTQIHTVPENMARSVSSSFATLIEANLSQFIKRQLQRMKQGNYSVEEASSLTATLFKQNHAGATSENKLPIELVNVTTSFVILPHESSVTSDNITSRRRLCLPLVFKMIAEVIIHGKTTRVPIEANGNISGFFNSQDSKMNHVDLSIDIFKLLRSMREEARRIILAAAAFFPTDPIRIPTPPPISTKDRQILTSLLDLKQDKFSTKRVLNVEATGMPLKKRRGVSPSKSIDICVGSSSSPETKLTTPDLGTLLQATLEMSRLN